MVEHRPVIPALATAELTAASGKTDLKGLGLETFILCLCIMTFEITWEGLMIKVREWLFSRNPRVALIPTPNYLPVSQMRTAKFS